MVPACVVVLGMRVLPAAPDANSPVPLGSILPYVLSVRSRAMIAPGGEASFGASDRTGPVPRRSVSGGSLSGGPRRQLAV